MKLFKNRFSVIWMMVCIFSGLFGSASAQYSEPIKHQTSENSPYTIYLPLVDNHYSPADQVLSGQGVNIPYFSDEVPFGERAVFWFGEVQETTNYTDVRIGYNDNELVVYLAVFDRRLWYDVAPTMDDLLAWDAASLYLDLDGSDDKSSLNPQSYRFDAQFSQSNNQDDYSAYRRSLRGGTSGWVSTPIVFTTYPGWRGNYPNDDYDDKGWAMTYFIPFDSLGLNQAPQDGETWHISVKVYDRDDAAGTDIPTIQWPSDAQEINPGTWAGARFGLPQYTTPAVSSTSTTVIRNRLNNAVVTDGEVGGGTSCASSIAASNYWTEWGNRVVYPGSGDYNVQNQSDISDWPCYSKIYITFPLDQIPAGRKIVSASLEMHQYGNSYPQAAQDSLIQVFRVTGSWDESTLTWNNAPQSLENVAQTWVTPVQSFPGWPGIPYTWDVSKAVADAYQSGSPLYLALYSADSAYHSGKYFVSSDTGDWNAVARPTLTVVWGTP